MIPGNGRESSLLRSWFEWSLRHIQDTEPHPKWIFNDSPLSYSNIERFDKDSTSLRLKGLYRRGVCKVIYYHYHITDLVLSLLTEFPIFSASERR